MKTSFKPELLSPAGNLEKMRSALHFGADAVYLAGKKFGMRAAADNFSDSELSDAISLAHSLGKKVYLTLNTMPREHDMPEIASFIEILNDIKPDALIVADMGVFDLCRKLAPLIPIHISTQAATVNSFSCNKWHEMGASRIVLARELSLRDIEAIRKNIPDTLELETFIHGSMCISFSGRCMLSEYYTGRDANRGACTQPCRWQYEFAETKRKDDLLTCEVWPEGSYLFGSKDLWMIEHIQDLIDVGIDSLKIEGRMKSAYYTAVVTNAYRIALDNPDQYFNQVDRLKNELESVSHREFCTGYYFDPNMIHSNLASNSGYLAEQSFLCSVEGIENDGKVICKQKNKFSSGDLCEYITPGKTGQDLKILSMFDMNNHEISSCPHPQMLFKITTDRPLKTGDLIRRK